jgi:hypothetical protein
VVFVVHCPPAFSSLPSVVLCVVETVAELVALPVDAVSEDEGGEDDATFVGDCVSGALCFLCSISAISSVSLSNSSLSSFLWRWVLPSIGAAIQAEIENEGRHTQIETQRHRGTKTTYKQTDKERESE